ncbi:AAA family ATPase [Mesonia ostreae]|uniref:AAA family ATPase n=1 Tax=Mesonia ostreae TaxID=861110 RepID=A0ABU2KK22_9FLAO|nr:AAA family ATPase [Mesonia ostreae]MDT0295060.1 AAA family ATPase [Mesonia ostreae]
MIQSIKNGKIIMLKINNIKIDVNTNNGLFGASHTFRSGLNIVRGNNTSGKSSLFQAIVYALGFEELIGGRFEKTMQSVLKDQVEFPKHTFHNVLQSLILLEIENTNGDIITIRRFVQNPNRKSQLIDVYFGSLSTNDNLKSRPMFIHDNGGASDENYGFHLYLEEFLNWELPKVLTNKGDLRKIYIQQIASSFIIE